MKKYLVGNDVINTIKLLLKHPSYKEKIILIVEGKSDIRLFRSLFDDDQIKFESIDGKKQLLEAMPNFIEHHKNKVLSISDADFDHIEGLEDTHILFDIFLTDYHDAEVMLLMSDSLKSFINEYAQEKYRSYLIINLLDLCFSIGKNIGILRYINLKNNLELNFKKLNLSLFVDIKLIDIKINLDTLIDVLISRSPQYKGDRYNLLKLFHEYNSLNLNNEQINCGHDLTNIIANIFRQKEISFETNMDINKVESALRISYTKDLFKKTNLFRKISNRITSINELELEKAS